ncbi:hypothetical protein DM01DRAFT_1332391 [Hesseltinella vesiculosa]|uniref:PQ-loop-domain-containing protein n=1 Tax=Hesseltinella vesiculosa TaxID=101127 RepID=A0A1X2GUW2_9FUNG|nr:hypothetical protein DM01DRAFT_1332391 [Hesseltinella vesiculosa]
MTDIFSIVLSFSMVFGPIVGYIDQYRIIKQRHSSEGFNSKACAILLFANILRVFFWLGKRFDTTLLLQSIVMIVTQLVLLEAVVYFRTTPTLLDDSSSETLSIVSEAGHPWTLAWQRRQLFWNWPTYLDYFNFLLAFTTAVGLLYVFLHQWAPFVEIIGFLSLSIESTLPIPQCIYHSRHRSTEGFSRLVLATWFLGDSFKVFYYAFTHAPIQFVGCGIFQLLVDFCLVFQCIWYSSTFRKWFHRGADYEIIE